LAGSIYVRSSIKLLHLVSFCQQTWPPRLILFSDWLMLKNSSPLKQLDQMEPSLAGSIYVRSKPGIDGPWVCPFQNCVRQPHPPFKMAAVFYGNDYLPLKFASVSFYCQVSDTGSVGWASSFYIKISYLLIIFPKLWFTIDTCKNFMVNLVEIKDQKNKSIK
jgi:hypothetical protein